MDDVSVNREVLAGDPFPLGATRSDETVEAHYAALERLETPHGCLVHDQATFSAMVRCS